MYCKSNCTKNNHKVKVVEWSARQTRKRALRVVVSASDSKTRISSSTPASAIIYDAYASSTITGAIICDAYTSINKKMDTCLHLFYRK